MIEQGCDLRRERGLGFVWREIFRKISKSDRKSVTNGQVRGLI